MLSAEYVEHYGATLPVPNGLLLTGKSSKPFSRWTVTKPSMIGTRWSVKEGNGGSQTGCI
jgi:hypothetical protein